MPGPGLFVIRLSFSGFGYLLCLSKCDVIALRRKRVRNINYLKNHRTAAREITDRLIETMPIHRIGNDDAAIASFWTRSMDVEDRKSVV